MPLKHKNSDEANKHTPKGFDNASNFSRLLRDEIGTSRYTRETTLPPALNFVDGANVPPTTVLNDVYVLIDNGGGAVNANWGGASYNDWVRFNGTNWGSVTPTAGDICYDQTAGIYKIFSTSWNDFISGGGGNISDSDLTFDANHYADLGAFSWTLGGTAPIGTEKISLQKNTLVKGSDTSSLTSGFKFIDSTNASLWDFRNNGDLYISKASVIDIGISNGITVNGQADGGKSISFNGRYVFKQNFASTLATVAQFETNSGAIAGRFGNDGSFTVGAVFPIGSEKISLQGYTVVKGANTSGLNRALGVYDSTNTWRFEVRNNGDLYTNGTQGLSGTYTFGGGSTGDIASMTYTNGLLTSVTTVP